MIVPALPAKFTLRDLAQLLKKIPKPDPRYWDVVEDINRNQPPLPESLWEG
jgi:hypothetical protein